MQSPFAWWLDLFRTERLAASHWNLTMQNQTPRKSAFTLIEMLLVVALICLLIALLLPGLGKARMAVRAAACAASQRQLTMAYQAYLRDNFQKSFIYIGNIGQHTFDNFWMALLEKYSGNMDELRICPEAARKSNEGVGTATLAWSGHLSTGSTWLASGGDHHYGSYALNGFLYRGYTTGWIKINDNVTSHDNVPVLGDSVWVDGWPGTYDLPATNLIEPYRNYQNGGPVPPQMARWTVDRHNMAINVTTLDGATRMTPLKKLWSYKWSTVFIPNAFVPPGL